MKHLFCSLLITAALAGLVAHWQSPQSAKPVGSVIKPSVTTAWVTPPARTFAATRSMAAPLTRARLSTADELTRALRSGTAADRDRAFNTLLPDLVTRDPALAGHLALAWEPGALRDEFLAQFIRRWTATDIGGAITWMTSLLDENDRQTAALAATAQVAQDDRAGAIELAQLLHVGVNDGSIEHMVQLWTEENPRDAVDWVTHRPADAFRDRMLARIAWTRASTDPAEAASLINQMSAGEARDEALLGVVRQWAGRDPIPASAWVAQFSSGPVRDRALATVAAASRVQ